MIKSSHKGIDQKFTPDRLLSSLQLYALKGRRLIFTFKLTACYCQAHYYIFVYFVFVLFVFFAS